jgi:hypothetical protein
MRLLATLAPAGQTGELLRELGAAPARPAPKVTRRNDRLHVRIALAPERAPGGGGGAAPHKVKAMAIDYLDLTFAVAAGRLLVASGPDAAARMDGMAREAIAPSRTGELRTLPLSERESRARELLAQALAQSRGAAAILYLDVVPFLKKMRLSTSHAAASLLALLLADELGSHTPVYVLVRGGEAVSFDVRMPIESLMRIRMIASIFDHTGAAPAEPAPAGGN